MHKLLARQLRRYLSQELLDSSELEGFISAVDTAYAQSDQDREMLERAMDLSSEEMIRINQDLQSVFDAIPDDIFQMNNRREVRHRKTSNSLPFLICEGAQYTNIYEVFSHDVAELYDSGLIEVLRSQRPYDFEFSCEAGDSRAHYEVRMVPVGDDQVLALTRDITQRKLSEEQIAWLAYHDSLTGLPNKRLFCERVDQAIVHADRHQDMLAVLYLDLDGFKLVNDTMGHEIGDNLLKQVTGRLQQMLGSINPVVADASQLLNAQTIARIGGDEFTILIDEMRDTSGVAQLLQSIIEEMEKPFIIDGKEIPLSASIGIAIYPQDGNGTNQLIKNADIAMYHAKELGKNNFQFFTEELNQASMERLLLDAGLRKARENSEFELYYQPQIDLRSDRVIGMEALLRWNHPDLGGIAPDLFIPIAEDSGQIIKIGEWVIQEALRQFMQWREAGYKPIRLSVNVSGKQLQQIEFIDFLANSLEQSGIDTDFFGVEITESSMLLNRQRTLGMLHEIKAMDIKLSMDDFGTGYSSLGYLKQFPIDCLKIDKSFIGDIAVSGSQAGLVKTIIDMGHVLGMEVVAEGVETQQQVEFLKRHGCDVAQGYHYSRPVKASEMEKLLPKRSDYLN